MIKTERHTLLPSRPSRRYICCPPILSGICRRFLLRHLLKIASFTLWQMILTNRIWIAWILPNECLVNGMAFNERTFAVQFFRSNAENNSTLSKIHFNPKDLKKSPFPSGAFILLKTSDKNAKCQALFASGIAWPLSTLKPSTIGLSGIWEDVSKPPQRVVIEVADTQNENIALHCATIAEFKVDSAVDLEKMKDSKAFITRYLHSMILDMYFFNGSVITIPLFGKRVQCRVQSIATDSNDASQTASHEIFKIDKKTKISIFFKEEHLVESVKRSTFAEIGGLEEEIRTIRQVMESSLYQPQFFMDHGLPPPKGILLFGPPGTGKSMLAKAVASEFKASFYTINGPELITDMIGENEARVRAIFKLALQNSPSIIFIDEIDVLCPKRHDRSSDLERRLVATFLIAMDGMNSKEHSQVMILAATNRPNALDPALRRSGRLDREIEIPVPNALKRLEILEMLLSSIPHSLTSDQVYQLSSQAHGYVGADLSAVCKEASLSAFRRACTTTGKSVWLASLSFSIKGFRVSLSDMQAALQKTRPSALQEIIVDVPKVYWHEIGGQETIKQQLKEVVEWPLTHPEAFTRMGIRPPKGVLLYGPPGCSKTMTAKALATESCMNFLAVKGPELFSKWVGESEKAIQSLFKKARAASPSIIFFDEFDAIAAQRSSQETGSQVSSRVISQLLTELDGIEPLQQVVIVAATNRPDLIDKALMRPGRIDRVLYVGPPGIQARESILSIHSQCMPIDPDVDFMQLAVKTTNFSGAELAALCREAAMTALMENRNAKHVEMRHFDMALVKIEPQINDDMLEFFDSFKRR
uniref:ATPase AFG2 protein putative n=1 Tax=Albugo laibachii Nc14 TaxID=890382 RepID=F0WCA4_9STRA|nr:ATPase AFG2 protein putative [Albugo laibachii Nc14]|eukprot:CCA18818.1 ATPase AFG2 protein putative [Albugo laibachii Nc14]